MKYNKKIIRYFLKPKNAGKIKNADSIGKVGNILCGDVMYLYLKIGKKKIGDNEQEYIKDIKFQTLGCPAAISCSSVVTELAKGKTLNEALKITNKDVLKVLGKLPKTKYHCSLLAEQALSEAIYNYLKKKNRKIPKELEKKHNINKKYGETFHKRFE